MYAEKDKDKKKAKTDPKVVTISFDLQKCLPTPLLSSGISFYKRNLWTFNLTLYDVRHKQPSNAYCYLWSETQALRGGQEITSILYRHILTIQPPVEEINFYCDSCPGQNKNIIIVVMLLYIIEKLAAAGRKMIINVKYLEPGHTHMEADTVHAIIERFKKTTTMDVEIPPDWAKLMRLIERKPRLQVVEMEQSEFYQFRDLLTTYYAHPKLTTTKQKVTWKGDTGMRHLQFRTDAPKRMFFKTSLDDKDFQEVDFSRKETKEKKQSGQKKKGKAGHNTATPSMEANTLPELFPIATESLPLSSEKVNDLNSLRSYISPASRLYYNAFCKTLKGSRSVSTVIYVSEDEDEIV
jgi:hypothetical protein